MAKKRLVHRRTIPGAFKTETEQKRQEYKDKKEREKKKENREQRENSCYVCK